MDRVVARAGSGARYRWVGAARIVAVLAAARARPAWTQQPADTTRPVPVDTTRTLSASVTSLAGTTVYVNAGRMDGLVEGLRMWTRRHDSTAAILRVQYLASHQSAAELMSGGKDLAVGDTVWFHPAAKSAASPQGTAAAYRPPRRLSGPGLHGRIGVRYLRADEGSAGVGFSEPSMDLRLDGMQLGGTPLGLAVDLRTRRTTTSSTSFGTQVDGHTRVYQAALIWGPPGAGFRVTVGRQYLTAVTSVSLFDGALVEIGNKHLTFGGFGGVEPDPTNLGFSSTTQDYGGYLQLHSTPGRPSFWTVSTGAVGSYANGVANREFAFAQAMFANQYISFFGLQEVDYYRPWKVALGESSISPTSTYLSGSFRPAQWISLDGSFDNRRSVRLYRDAVDPLTAFDDAYREGLGAGVTLIGYRLRASGDVHRSTGGSAGESMTYTGTLGVTRLTSTNLSVTGRVSAYTNNSSAADIRGWIYAASAGLDPTNMLHLGLDGGYRRETSPLTTPATTGYTWFGGDADLSLARAWSLSLSVNRQSGPNSRTTQFYGGVAWRF